MKNKIVIGIDQSYNNTGVSVASNGKLKCVNSIWLDKLKTNSDKRKQLKQYLYNVFNKMSNRASQSSSELCVIIERIRLQSQGFINIDYIKSIGALNACIVDTANEFNIKVFSVDTRSWKSQVVGTSKPAKNIYGVPEEKWPTMNFVWGLDKKFKKQLMYEVSNQCKKDIYMLNGKKYRFNNDAADSACIALYGFIPEEKQKLEEEH